MNKTKFYMVITSFCLGLLTSLMSEASIIDTLSSSFKTNVHVDRLQESLSTYQAISTVPIPYIKLAEKNLKIGAKEPLILLIKKYLILTRDLNIENDLNECFDAKLESAVKFFQWRNGIKADGIIGKETVKVMNIPLKVRAEQIKINIERWKKFYSEINDSRFILVNIPEYQMYLVDNNQIQLTMKVIVGRPSRPTPEISSSVSGVTLNPFWNIPPSILKKDIFPKILQNKNFFSESRIRIYKNQNGNLREVNIHNISLDTLKSKLSTYYFRQDPGEENSLGLMRFYFANDYSIYMHDTPAKNLFSLMKRDTSSGCIRLENAFNLLEYLVINDSTINKNEIDSALSSKETKYFKLQQPIPIYIRYMTAWVDDRGVLHFVNDIYHRDIIY